MFKILFFTFYANACVFSLYVDGKIQNCTAIKIKNHVQYFTSNAKKAKQISLLYNQKQYNAKYIVHCTSNIDAIFFEQTPNLKTTLTLTEPFDFGNGDFFIKTFDGTQHKCYRNMLAQELGYHEHICFYPAQNCDVSILGAPIINALTNKAVGIITHIETIIINSQFFTNIRCATIQTSKTTEHNKQIEYKKLLLILFSLSINYFFQYYWLSKFYDEMK